MNEIILKDALVPKEWWPNCHVVGNMIYTPLFDSDGNIIKTGRQMYADSLTSKNLPTMPTVEDRISLLEALELERILGE